MSFLLDGWSCLVVWLFLCLVMTGLLSGNGWLSDWLCVCMFMVLCLIPYVFSNGCMCSFYDLVWIWLDFLLHTFCQVIIVWFFIIIIIFPFYYYWLFIYYYYFFSYGLLIIQCTSFFLYIHHTIFPTQLSHWLHSQYPALPLPSATLYLCQNQSYVFLVYDHQPK